jgi:hypothetical protein
MNNMYIFYLTMAILLLAAAVLLLPTLVHGPKKAKR